MNQAELKALESLAWRWENRDYAGNDIGAAAARTERKCAKELRAFLSKVKQQQNQADMVPHLIHGGHEWHKP